MQTLRIQRSTAATPPKTFTVTDGMFRLPSSIVESTSCFAVVIVGRHRALLTRDGLLRWQGKRAVQYGSFEFSVASLTSLRHSTFFDEEPTKGVREKSGHHHFDLATGDGRTFELTPEPLIIGRHRSCDIQFDDPQVSQFHLALHLRDGLVELHDLESRNGTRFNGNEVKSGRISSGRIQLGRSKLSVNRREADSATRLESLAMLRVYEKLVRVGPTDVPVMILGESGTGKDFAAQYLHSVSGRQGRFVALNSAGIKSSLSSSELFGHVRGSFTGAVHDHLGAFREAQDGTLFLDEIGEMPLDIQAELLRAVEQKEVRPVGSSERVKVNARIVGATNRDLGKMVTEGSFREDLYHRLMVVPVEITPLRERPEDVETLADFILAQQDVPRRLALKALDKLKAYDWPGNIRELANALRRAVINTDNLVIHETDIEFRPPRGEGTTVGKLLHEEIIAVFKETESIAETAKRLSLRRPLVREHVELWKREQRLKLT